MIGVTWTLFHCAPLFVAQGRHEHAVRVLGAGLALTKVAQGRGPSPLWRSLVERRLDSAQRALSPETGAAAWTEGQGRDGTGQDWSRLAHASVPVIASSLWAGAMATGCTYAA